MLTDEQIHDFESRLNALRGELEALLETTSEGAKPVDLDQPIGRVSRIDAIQQQKMISANRRGIEIRLLQAHAAMTTIENGEYGECKRCEEDIGYGRLKARPETPLCVQCQRAIETRS